jgi:K(+)-stimulated pyrophosphate-energized sodium pump
MTELLLICAIGALGVAFATTVARWVAQRPVGDAELARASEVVNGGVVRYLRRQNVVAASVAAVVGATVFLVYGIAYQTETLDAVSPREHGVWLTVAYILGAGFGVATATVAAWMARQASARVAAGARRSLDESLQIAVRAGAVSGVVALALALLGLAGLFLAFYIYAGGLADSALALVRAPDIPLLLTGFALGAAFVALLSQIGGGIYGNVADIGADVAGKLEASLSEDSADNPAVVADLVGDMVGDGAARVAGVFAAAVVESVAAMLVASALYEENEDLTSVTAVILFPLVARTFSLLAAWFGVMVVRTDDTEVPMNAVARGLHVTTLLYAVGAVGCAKWLLGPYWLRFGACAVLGSAAGLGCLYVTQYYSEQKYRPVRMLAEAARGGATLAALRGIFTATEGALVHVMIVVASVVGSYLVGSQTGLVGGGLFGVAIAVGGMLGSAPYVLAMDGLGSIADTAGGIIEMTVAAERPDVRARARLLDAVGTTTKSYTRILVTLTSSISCFLLLSTFLMQVWSGADEQGALIDVSSPLLYVGAVLGVIVVLVFIWVTLRRITISGRELVNELRVQLGADVRGAAADSPLRTTSELGSEANGQLACVEIVSRVALRGMLAPAIVGVGVPLLIGVVLRLLPSGDRVTTSAEALVALLVVATIAGAFGSLLFTNAGSAWDNAKKYIETGAHGGRYLVDPNKPTRTPNATNDEAAEYGGELNNPTYVAAVIGDTVGDPLKGAIGPATPVLVITLAAFALVFLPFFL